MNDSPRWCEKCSCAGDHHTDRHDEMLAGEARLAVWNPKRGRVHRIMANWRPRYYSEQTRCGMPTRNMTERADAEGAPLNRCLTCWRGAS